MSTQVLPDFPGLGFDVTRTPMWSTTIQSNISGKEVRLGMYSSPRYQWELKYNFLRQGTLNGVDTYAEFEQLLGFFNTLNGAFDTFLFKDPADNTAINQAIGIGDGSTTAFQLASNFGNYVQPILAPNVVTAIKVNSSVQAPTSYTVNKWGSAAPGVINFNSAPAAGGIVTADFTYYFPVRFVDDTLKFNQSLSPVWGLNSAQLISIK